MKIRTMVQWFLGGAAIVMVTGALGADAPGVAPAANSNVPTAMSAGLMAKQSAAVPEVIFEHALADAPGKNLVVVALRFPPKSARGRVGSPSCMGHHHPGSVYVYVTQGTARLGLAGQPVHVVHTGESFFEPVGALHTVGESASATEPASAIAVMIVPDGAPRVIPACGPR